MGPLWRALFARTYNEGPGQAGSGAEPLTRESESEAKRGQNLGCGKRKGEERQEGREQGREMRQERQGTKKEEEKNGKGRDKGRREEGEEKRDRREGRGNLAPTVKSFKKDALMEIVVPA